MLDTEPTNQEPTEPNPAAEGAEAGPAPRKAAPRKAAPRKRAAKAAAPAADAPADAQAAEAQDAAPPASAKTPRKRAAKAAAAPAVPEASAIVDDPASEVIAPPARKAAPRKRAAKAAAAPAPDAADPAADSGPLAIPDEVAAAAPAVDDAAIVAAAVTQATAPTRTRRRATKAASAPAPAAEPTPEMAQPANEVETAAPPRATRRRRATAPATTAPATAVEESPTAQSAGSADAESAPSLAVAFLAPTDSAAAAPARPTRTRRRATRAAGTADARAAEPTLDPAAALTEDDELTLEAEAAEAEHALDAQLAVEDADLDTAADTEDADDADTEDDAAADASEDAPAGGSRRRRRGRRGRGGRSGRDGAAEEAEDGAAADAAPAGADAGDAGEDVGNEDVDNEDSEDGDADEAAGSSTRRRRKRRRRGSGGGSAGEDDPAETVVHVREPARPREAEDEVRGIRGSTRLEAKRQRRRDTRDTGRRRAPILTEAEFLARREAVDRVMALRQRGDRTQIAVLEDGILVEHYVTRASATSYVGNIYLGRVQNVLPSMEAAFVDIGKGRNGVLYAGEVNWDAAGLAGRNRTIQDAMSSGDAVLVQVTKDPIGHKGARLTSQISLPGRFLVYVPNGGMTGISRKLPDTERSRLKAILKKIVPEDAGVIIRTAAEGASEQELTQDVERLKALWESIQAAVAKPKNAPVQVHAEPDLAIRVVRDVFNEDFQQLIVSGDPSREDDAWTTVSQYVDNVAPELAPRLSKYTGSGDLFHDLRVDEQLAKALDRKVWLPSGGSLVIDRTEAMTVIDVNTGKFTGAGGNLEQTVTRNNIEAAEEIVRQLRLRDIGGMVVVDFIDMVLESNRDLVLRRLTECLGRDRTKHQVAEVTSLGLVQMTRKRVGEGLLEAFSEPCEHCQGRGVIVHVDPVTRRGETYGSGDSSDGGGSAEGGGRSGKRRRRGRGGSDEPDEPAAALPPEPQRKAAASMMARIAGAVALAEDGEPTADAADDVDVVDVVDVAADDFVEAPSSAELDVPEVVAVPEVPEVPELAVQAVFDGEPAPEPEPAAEPEPEPAPAASARPRRRRAASRPAGPPSSA